MIPNDFLLDSGRVVMRGNIEVEYFANEKDAKSYVLHVYGKELAKSLPIEIKPIKNRGPKPGDAICYRGGGSQVDYLLKAYESRPARTEIFGVLQNGADNAMCCFDASAYREDGRVSCSGGPLPFIELSDLTFMGFKQTLFWRFSNGYPEAHTGGYYYLNVPLWLWKPQTN